MSLRHNLQLIRGGLLGPRNTRRSADTSAAMEFLGTSRLVAVLIFVLTVVAIVFISFVGVSTTNLPVLPGQLATVRIEASVPFSYVSQEKSRAARDAIVDRVPPVYRLDFAPLQQFETHIRELLVDLEKFERDYPSNAPRLTDRREALAALVDAFNAKGPYRASADDVAALLDAGDAKLRFTLVESGLAALREIYTEGVHDSSLEQSGQVNSVTVYQILRPNGEITQRPVQSLEQALTFLRINLFAEGTPRPLATALFRIFRNGIKPNIVFDRDATQSREKEAVKALKPVMVKVERGQTIIEPGTHVTPDQYEMLMAHRQHLIDSGDTARDEGRRLVGRTLLVLAMVMASVFYIRLEDRETTQNNGRLALLALVVIVNLALVRVTYSLLSLDFFVRDGSWASTLPYFAPTALAPLIVAILIDAGSAIFMALLISIFTGVIYGNRLDLLVLTFLASMVAIFGCRHVRKRGVVVRAAGAGGLTVAAFGLLIGIVDQVPWVTLGQQMGAGLLTGLLTGIVVVGVLPVLESLFKRTTDITLLELTDFNHPLLRLMQLEAPGTYHHSLVVAQLSENASNAIGANPLLARVCALFHDIGKTVKPEYFSENQRAGTNPHDLNNPSLSALIIKSHVKEGVDLAHKHKLPRAVIDVIQQHHGTSLIRYFYERAKTESVAPFPIPAGAPRPARAGDSREPFTPVAESTYRYDGPRPQFKESAVISLADAVEAASRSLRKVTPQHLGELIESAFRDRISDAQLDEAPLTFAELAQIKSSFTFTLLNMLHARVAYPGGAETAAETPRQKSDAS
jgi:putative nucleotidyltransferase with HDIG domain